MEISKPKIAVRDIVYVGMFAAFLAVMSQIQIPMPGGVPVTIQVFAVALVAAVLGWKLGTLAVIVYILLGITGLPIFAGFQGGLGVLFGTAGGYMFGWLALSLLAGATIKTGDEKKNLVINAILALIGLAVVETLGGLQWSLVAGTDIRTIVIYSFTAFIPKDIIITILAVAIGRKIRKTLVNAGLL